MYEVHLSIILERGSGSIERERERERERGMADTLLQAIIHLAVKLVSSVWKKLPTLVESATKSRNVVPL